MVNSYYARSSDHGYETCVEHLCMAGCLSGAFAQQFGYLDDGLLAGLFHDLGKYSDAFQRRIRNPEHSMRVDHSAAGAILMGQHSRMECAMAVAGHHAGLADLGTAGDIDAPTFMSRIRRAVNAGKDNPLLLANAWEKQISIPDDSLNSCAEFMPSYETMMRIRMLLSALVDGDRLDAEFFTSNRLDRAEHNLLEYVKCQLGAEALEAEQSPSWNKLRETALEAASNYDSSLKESICQLTDTIERESRRYLDNPNKSPLNIKRCELLQQCIDKGKDSEYGTGLYTLTAPTGSGKTLSSIAFALEHARTQGLQRVIYVIPYMSIIDQTVEGFEKIFGEDAVLPHYSEASYQLKDESDMSEIDLKRALAAENWNAPIVVTTAVQFFESLYSNKTSRCRKLHNIANSVIVFDEAQTLPVSYLRPCVKAIGELVEHYHVTAVLCTATQPELKPLFDQALENGCSQIPEISPFSDSDQEAFARTTITSLESNVDLDDLALRLCNHNQVLCVANTRKDVQYLYRQLKEVGTDDGTYCLTTLQCAADRKRLLSEMRSRLADGKTCRVVSTSLIEAGVDVDFPIAYREEAGLDSILQTAGRCNREGRRSRAESMVYVFSSGGRTPLFLYQNVSVFRDVKKRYRNRLDAAEAVHEYFCQLLALRDGAALGSRNDPLDKKCILDLCDEDTMPFAEVARNFHLIDNQTSTVYIPLAGEGQLLCKRLESGDVDRGLFRQLGRYSVNVWSQHLDKLQSTGAIMPVSRNGGEEDCFILRDMSLYTSELGLTLDETGPDGIFI